MPLSKEFVVQLEDRPGTLGKLSKALAEKKVNILAFQSFPSSTAGKESTVRLIVDNPTTAKAVFDGEGVKATENEVAQVRLPNRPGELARAASQLGDAAININYAYAGIEPGTNAPLLFFGVKELPKAVAILDETAAKAA